LLIDNCLLNEARPACRQAGSNQRPPSADMSPIGYNWAEYIVVAILFRHLILIPFLFLKHPTYLEILLYELQSKGDTI